ncbi:MAG: lipid droplet-associated protein, partial [Mycobacterium sp.]
EQPEWATFDEDLSDEETAPSSSPDSERMTEGRFALFSGGGPETSTEESAEPTAAEQPEIVTRLDYETLTLAQLRARLSSLRIADLEALLAYEDATKSRAPFQTLLANRITRANAK